MSDTNTGNGKVVVNRSMSLDGFIAGPGDAMNWIFDFMGPIEDEFPEIMAATFGTSRSTRGRSTSGAIESITGLKMKLPAFSWTASLQR